MTTSMIGFTKFLSLFSACVFFLFLIGYGSESVAININNSFETLVIDGVNHIRIGNRTYSAAEFNSFNVGGIGLIDGVVSIRFGNSTLSSEEFNKLFSSIGGKPYIQSVPVGDSSESTTTTTIGEKVVGSSPPDPVFHEIPDEDVVLYKFNKFEDRPAVVGNALDDDESDNSKYITPIITKIPGSKPIENFSLLSSSRLGKTIYGSYVSAFNDKGTSRIEFESFMIGFLIRNSFTLYPQDIVSNYGSSFALQAYNLYSSEFHIESLIKEKIKFQDVKDAIGMYFDKFNKMDFSSLTVVRSFSDFTYCLDAVKSEINLPSTNWGESSENTALFSIMASLLRGSGSFKLNAVCIDSFSFSIGRDRKSLSKIGLQAGDVRYLACSCVELVRKNDYAVLILDSYASSAIQLFSADGARKDKDSVKDLILVCANLGNYVYTIPNQVSVNYVCDSAEYVKEIVFGRTVDVKYPSTVVQYYRPSFTAGCDMITWLNIRERMFFAKPGCVGIVLWGYVLSIKSPLPIRDGYVCSFGTAYYLKSQFNEHGERVSRIQASYGDSVCKYKWSLFPKGPLPSTESDCKISWVNRDANVDVSGCIALTVSKYYLSSYSASSQSGAPVESLLRNRFFSLLGSIALCSIIFCVLVTVHGHMLSVPRPAAGAAASTFSTGMIRTVINIAIFVGFLVYNLWYTQAYDFFFFMSLWIHLVIWLIGSSTGPATTMEASTSLGLFSLALIVCYIFPSVYVFSLSFIVVTAISMSGTKSSGPVRHISYVSFSLILSYFTMVYIPYFANSLIVTDITNSWINLVSVILGLFLSVLGGKPSMILCLEIDNKFSLVSSVLVNASRYGDIFAWMNLIMLTEVKYLVALIWLATVGYFMTYSAILSYGSVSKVVSRNPSYVIVGKKSVVRFISCIPVNFVTFIMYQLSSTTSAPFDACVLFNYMFSLAFLIGFDGLTFIWCLCYAYEWYVGDLTKIRLQSDSNESDRLALSNEASESSKPAAIANEEENVPESFFGGFMKSLIYQAVKPGIGDKQELIELLKTMGLKKTLGFANGTAEFSVDTIAKRAIAEAISLRMGPEIIRKINLTFKGIIPPARLEAPKVIKQSDDIIPESDALLTEAVAGTTAKLIPVAKKIAAPGVTGIPPTAPIAVPNDKPALPRKRKVRKTRAQVISEGGEIDGDVHYEGDVMQEADFEYYE